ncbi:MAG: hypothetical protein JWN14_2372 [Chthonomonadales bacterium]|nr:hypothetical protein [Chthonomonadales bacterium]
MIGIAQTLLPPAIQTELDTLQANINNLPNFSDRVTAASRQFASQNRIDNRTFDEIKVVLTTMCAGARRCMYCEDSVADEVEHIKPKALYPEAVFVWLNYLYACGPCNGPKNANFKVFSAASGRMTNVTRRRKAAVVPPTSGNPVLIDPRIEDPLDFMILDLSGTFFFVEMGSKRSLQYKRAKYTIELLKLNQRDYLVTARKRAAHSYSVHLRDYLHRRDAGATQAELDQLIKALQDESHPTVWKEIQRQRKTVLSSGNLFALAPEALNW